MGHGRERAVVGVWTCPCCGAHEVKDGRCAYCGVPVKVKAQPAPRKPKPKPLGSHWTR